MPQVKKGSLGTRGSVRSLASPSSRAVSIPKETRVSKDSRNKNKGKA